MILFGVEVTAKTIWDYFIHDIVSLLILFLLFLGFTALVGKKKANKIKRKLTLK